MKLHKYSVRVDQRCYRIFHITRYATARISGIKFSSFWSRLSAHATCSSFSHWTICLSNSGGENVGVTGIDDSHGGATEHLSGSGSEFNLCNGSVSINVALQGLYRDFFSERRGPSHAKAHGRATHSVDEENLTLLPLKWWTAVLASME